MGETAKILRKEFMALDKDPPPGISASPNDENIHEWDAIICGPEDTPFEGGVFKLKLKFPTDYPQKPPQAWFYSRMFHPNVYEDGKICLDILEIPEKWTSDYNAGSVLCGIQSMLGDPNPYSPANGVANGLFMKDMDEYLRRVKEVVDLSDLDEDANNLNEDQRKVQEELDLCFAVQLQLQAGEELQLPENNL